jgi:hypothetical protein
MKNIFALFMLVGLTACNQDSITHECDADVYQLPDATISTVVPKATKIVTGLNWRFVLPGSGWSTSNAVLSDIQSPYNIIYQNNETLVSFIKNEASNDEYSYYIVETMKAVQSRGMEIKSAKNLRINDQPFVRLETVSGKITAWMWLSLKDNFGYWMTCGGPDSPSQTALCIEIADTIKIN